jgi:hypothetical protein
MILAPVEESVSRRVGITPIYHLKPLPTPI